MTGVFIGVLFACGVLLVAHHVIATRPARMTTRLAPYLPHSVTVQPTGPIVVLAQLFAPVWGTVTLRVGVNSSLAERLNRAGKSASIQRYRLTQLVWIGAGLGVATIVVIVTSNASALGLVVIGIGGALGALACDSNLKLTITRRQRRILTQLPMVADLFAFSVAAGESAVAAIERLSRTMSGELPREFATCVGDVHNGVPFSSALRAAAQRCDVPAFTRFVEGIVLALERGTPIAEVVRAQAMDVRAQEQRRLMELAGRKDVIMLIPIVFLILPSVVLIAVYPGLYSLDLVVA